MELIIFTTMGRTFKFVNVESFEPTTQGFKFTYTGVATGVTRNAEFNNTSVAGYAFV